jgi:hypothetical protein
MTALMTIAYIAGVGGALAFFLSRRRLAAVIAAVGFAAIITLTAVSGTGALTFGIILIVGALALGGALWIISPRQAGAE